MDYRSNPAHPFHGIGKKLERADQNIINLQTEIAAFFNSCEYPTFPDPKDKRWQQAVDYHKGLAIPVRFGVLAGEIVHHLRSSLDHLVWIFSSENARKEKGDIIGFPIFLREPSTPNKIERFDRQIQGVTDSGVRDRIVALQPYHRGSNAIDDPLAIIHQMDRFDKHRELVLIDGGVTFALPSQISPELAAALRCHDEGKPMSLRQKAIIGDALKDHHSVALTVLFPKFGNRCGQAVIPSLTQLINAVVGIIESFEIFAL